MQYGGGFPYCGAVVKNPPADAGDAGSIPGLGRSPEERKAYPLQYSSLKNSIVQGVTISWTWLSNFHFHFHCDRLQKWPQVIPTFFCDLVMRPCSFFYQFPLLITSGLTCNFLGSVFCGRSDVCEFLSLDLRRPCRLPFSFLKPCACRVNRSELAGQRMMTERDTLVILSMLGKLL